MRETMSLNAKDRKRWKALKMAERRGLSIREAGSREPPQA